jgi:hypothetical protein
VLAEVVAVEDLPVEDQLEQAALGLVEGRVERDVGREVERAGLELDGLVDAAALGVRLTA